MADHGLKSDFDGQWNHHWNNIYGYVGSCYNEGPWLAFCKWLPFQCLIVPL
jgi:hypothetical protein